MRTKATGYKHIRLWPDGTPTVRGTRMKVRQIAQLYRGGTSAEEIQQHYPDYTLAEIFSALAYYQDHRSEIDRRIDELTRIELEMRAQWEQSEHYKGLREKIDAFRRRQEA